MRGFLKAWWLDRLKEAKPCAGTAMVFRHDEELFDEDASKVASSVAHGGTIAYMEAGAFDGIQEEMRTVKALQLDEGQIRELCAKAFRNSEKFHAGGPRTAVQRILMQYMDWTVPDWRKAMKGRNFDSEAQTQLINLVLSTIATPKLRVRAIVGEEDDYKRLRVVAVHDDGHILGKRVGVDEATSQYGNFEGVCASSGRAGAGVKVKVFKNSNLKVGGNHLILVPGLRGPPSHELGRVAAIHGCLLRQAHARGDHEENTEQPTTPPFTARIGTALCLLSGHNPYHYLGSIRAQGSTITDAQTWPQTRSIGSLIPYDTELVELCAYATRVLLSRDVQCLMSTKLKEVNIQVDRDGNPFAVVGTKAATKTKRQATVGVENTLQCLMVSLVLLHEYETSTLNKEDFLAGNEGGQRTWSDSNKEPLRLIKVHETLTLPEDPSSAAQASASARHLLLGLAVVMLDKGVLARVDAEGAPDHGVVTLDGSLMIKIDEEAHRRGVVTPTLPAILYTFTDVVIGRGHLLPGDGLIIPACQFGRKHWISLLQSMPTGVRRKWAAWLAVHHGDHYFLETAELQADFDTAARQERRSLITAIQLATHGSIHVRICDNVDGNWARFTVPITEVHALEGLSRNGGHWPGETELQVAPALIRVWRHVVMCSFGPGATLEEAASWLSARLAFKNCGLLSNALVWLATRCEITMVPGGA